MTIKNIVAIKTEDILADEHQPRQVFGKMDLHTLAETLKEDGLLVPVKVTPFIKRDGRLIVGKGVPKKGFKYFVIDGARRTMAAKILKWESIQAEVVLDIDLYTLYRMQFLTNCKRVQIDVKEMAKAVIRFKEEFFKKNPKGNVNNELSKITGFSQRYFQGIEAINRAPKELRDLIDKDKVGPYVAREIEGITRNKDERRGLAEFYVKKAKKGIKPTVLLPRTIKSSLKRLEKAGMSPTQRSATAEALITREYNKIRGITDSDKQANFKLYQQEIEEFKERIDQWNFRGLTQQELNIISSMLIELVDYVREVKRSMGKLQRKGQ